MGTTVVNECDKCGMELKMDNDSAKHEFGKWLSAKVVNPPAGGDKSSLFYEKMWCSRCWDQISRRSAQYVEKAG